ncbi:MAG TPA: DUF3352 domain-containing protein [Solirubrobacterales bacterium]|nr:DUF3352 domain-containing protein [Solirubrobacterales bacterium]
MIRRAAIGLVACAAILVTGCGGGGDDGSDELASLAPADAPVYLESVVRPEGEQSDAINSLASRIGGIDDPGTAIVQQLDAELSQANATYEDDVAPWLGERAAVFFESFDGDPPPFAAIFETTDTGAAQDFVEKVVGANPGSKQDSYNGVDYLQDPEGTNAAGVVGDFLVYGTLDGFKAAVDASGGSSLADSSNFEDGVSALPTDNLALGYADGAQAAEQITGVPVDPLEATALKAAIQTLATGPITFALSATPDTASVDISLPAGVAGQLGESNLVARGPADAWFAVGVQNLGTVLGNAVDAANSLQLPSVEDQIKQATGLDPQDIISWMGQGYGFVSGTSEKTIAIGGVVQSSDQGASSGAIATLRKRFQADVDAELGPPPQGADEGFSASAPEAPSAIQVGQFGDQVVAALGPGQPAADALHPKSTLADDPAFQAGLDAMGADFSPLAFVSLAPFFVVAEKGGQANDPDYLAAKPYLQKLDYLILGTSGDDDRTTARFVVGVE